MWPVVQTDSGLRQFSPPRGAAWEPEWSQETYSELRRISQSCVFVGGWRGVVVAFANDRLGHFTITQRVNNRLHQNRGLLVKWVLKPSDYLLSCSSQAGSLSILCYRGPGNATANLGGEDTSGASCRVFTACTGGAACSVPSTPNLMEKEAEQSIKKMDMHKEEYAQRDMVWTA